MKPIKLTTIILAGVIIVFASALVVILLNQRNPRLQEPSAPAAIEETASGPIQPVVKPKLITLRQATDSNFIKAKSAAKPVVTTTAAGPKQKLFRPGHWESMPTSQFDEHAAAPIADDQSQSSSQERYLPPRRYKPMLEDRQIPIMTQEQQRHIERYQVLKDAQRVQVSKERQEQMKDELFFRLPERYRELFKDIEQMKAEQLEKSKQAVPDTEFGDYAQEPNG